MIFERKFRLHYHNRLFYFSFLTKCYNCGSSAIRLSLSVIILWIFCIPENEIQIQRLVTAELPDGSQKK
jgi:hypothetical protein